MTELAGRLQAQLGTNYVIDRELSGGGMSRVFLARDLGLEREVAVKVLPSGLAATVSLERFRREIMLAAALQHPNVVPVLSAGEVDGLPYFLMPYVRGESLRGRLQRGPLSVREAIGILKDVARALAYAHDRGIIHRDIKPDNILLSAGAAMVADFGVAKAITASRHAASRGTDPSMTGAGISLGTPAYMSPEQALADPGADQRADIYSLGVVAYEMLVGVPPFHGRSQAAVVAAHIQERPRPIAARRYDVPAPLTALVMQCLEKEPDRRPRTATAVLRALDDTDLSTDALAAARRPPGYRRRRWAAGGAAALLLVATTYFASRQGGTGLGDSTGAPPGARSVTVAPLRSVNDDAREVAIAAAMTAELITALSQVRGFRVGTQGGSALLDGADTSAVDLRLGGTIHREGGRVRVNVRLVDVRRDSTMWAHAHEGSVDSVFALQAAVTDVAVEALSRASPPPPREP